ncbi:hypothetical protein OTU49_012382 [Cherax quadricarinatus]|uniref:Uncharacterized protein n=1 Tax=Cherax quadricarinatus TaxID=27406 RepID=A0AAW0W1R5_CHEQU
MEDVTRGTRSYKNKMEDVTRGTRSYNNKMEDVTRGTRSYKNKMEEVTRGTRSYKNKMEDGTGRIAAQELNERMDVKVNRTVGTHTGLTLCVRVSSNNIYFL